jgi:UDP-2,4-diacetamido-2,4,6-trideoxy-beta-L-altropyranose hydrolase
MTVELRPAAERDSARVLAWRNDPFILARGSSRRPVAPAEHEAWFRASLAAPMQRLLYIVEVEGAAAGLVRFDRADPDGAVLSVYLVEAATGRGRGIAAIREGCARAFAAWPVARVVACTRADNAAALKAFPRAGFAAEPHGLPACPDGQVRFELRRPATARGVA